MLMRLNSLSLVNFRNYQDEYFEFGNGVNFIYGGNAQGKTNLLEAIYLLSTGRSFRTQQLSNLIYDGADAFILEAHFIKDGVSQVLNVWSDGTSKKIRHNATNYAHFSPLLGLIPAVLFAPEDVMLINGPPAKRRRFLDLHIAQQDPLYVHHLIRYYRAMRHRNQLLKTKSLASISPWEHQMALSGQYIIAARDHTLKTLTPYLKTHLRALTHEIDQIELLYTPSLPELSPAHFESWRTRDLRFGTTLCGPHKDEIDFQINGASAKTHASEGQKRSCLSALKLSEAEKMSSTLDFQPLVCFDDFGVHLDRERKELLKSELSNLGQVFVTAPALESGFPQTSTLIHIEKGKVLV